MTDRIEPLQDVLKVVRAGAEFYEEAAGKVDNSSHAELFRKMATVRRMAIADISTHICASGEEPESADWSEKARSWYGRMRGRIGNDETWVAQLEEHEDRTLDAIKTAMSDAIDTPQHAVLERHLHAFRATHDHMKALKDRLAA